MKHPSLHSSPRQHGSVLIIVLWVALGLVSLTIYFGQTAMMQYRNADNRMAGIEADQAIEGASRYVTYILRNYATNGFVPNPDNYAAEMAPVGESDYWLIGRDDQSERSETPAFALVDESSKLNLNTATREMLEALPNMTSELAAAIIDWRDTDDEATTDGAESDYYMRMNPAYLCKNAPFETVEELRMVRGCTPELLFGEDWNRNGILDENENDGSSTAPLDNTDGRLDPGLVEYLTIYSREPNTKSDGTNRVNITSNQQQLVTALTEKLGQQRAQQIAPAASGCRSLLEFYIKSKMTASEFALVADDLTTSSATYQEGLVNVNTAREEVLACIPGIGIEKAATMVAYRKAHKDESQTLAWVSEVLDQASAVQAGPYLTARSYQFTADIVALGRNLRGYRRVAFVFDNSQSEPQIIFRRDLTRFGWALGNINQNSWTLTRRSR